MSVAPKISEFMGDLAKELVEKKGVAETTAHAYVKTLYLLNDKNAFKTLSFLRKKDEILAKVREYSPSTQKSILASLVSVLSLVNEKPTYKGVYKFFYDTLADEKKATAPTNNEKTEKQQKNWIGWKEVKEISEKQHKNMQTYCGKKTITAAEYAHLLQTLVLSLYVLLQPRRNQDYLDMLVVKKHREDMPTDKNYLDLATSRFIFNKYKTSKKYGTQTLAVPEPLMETILSYLKFHPLYKASKGKDPVPFLVNEEGKPLTAVNAITRILNKVFGKRVGSSMLRHIFLSDKYDVDEMQKDAEAMGHSLHQQRDYLRKDDEQIVEVPTTSS